MTSWHEGPRAAFDLETTGRDPLSARIVTATVILLDGDGAVLEHHEWLADPGVEIPDGAAAVHGITTSHARAHGLAAVEVVRGISAVLARLFAAGVPVLAYNARYDFTVLAQEGRRHGVPTPRPTPVIDPFIMDKQADRYRRGKRTLTALCEHYGIRFENAHTSAADVLATLQVGQVLAEHHAFLRKPAADLHASLVVWADRQAADFEEYLRRTEPDAVIERAWPVIEPVMGPVMGPVVEDTVGGGPPADPSGILAPSGPRQAMTAVA
ncbi:3'-5' exonuclease [Arthrobacter sp. NPDC092385]|uniref:3'-5' exonuclease n=1 Tax=Arthrobacter sp. NPDC092385 TaxID=3363943 RepID=UPI00381E8E65